MIVFNPSKPKAVLRMNVLLLLGFAAALVSSTYVPANVNIEEICQRQLNGINAYITSSTAKRPEKLRKASKAMSTLELWPSHLVSNYTKDGGKEPLLNLIRVTLVKEGKGLNEENFRKSKYWNLVTKYFEESELTTYDCHSFLDMHNNLLAKAVLIIKTIKREHDKYLKDAHNDDHLWLMDYFMNKLWLIIDYQRTVLGSHAIIDQLDEINGWFTNACACGETELYCRVWRQSITQPTFMPLSDAMKTASADCDQNRSTLYYVQACRSALLIANTTKDAQVKLEHESHAINAASCFLLRHQLIQNRATIKTMQDVHVVVEASAKAISAQVDNELHVQLKSGKVERLGKISERMDKLRGVLVPPFNVLTSGEKKEYFLYAAEVCIKAHQVFDPK